MRAYKLHRPPLNRDHPNHNTGRAKHQAEQTAGYDSGRAKHQAEQTTGAPKAEEEQRLHEEQDQAAQRHVL